MINRYTVIGQPIAHSLSPLVHHLFGDLTQRKVHYTRTEAQPDTFEPIVLDLQQSGLKGCNITAPFKELAVQVCDRVVPHARRAGSVNTIHMQRDGARVGYNTDGAGLVADISINKRRPLENQRILILGAGGAVRGVLGPLLAKAPAVLHIANRTPAKAEALATLFSDDGELSAGSYEALESEQPFDIIINATAVSLEGGMPTLPDSIVGNQTLAYDMTYAAGNTAFMSWSESHGASISNGLGMLVEQAAESFLIWEGVRPKTRMAYPRLKELLSSQ